MRMAAMETYHGYVRTPADAIKLFEACRLGLLPRVQRRLSEKERQSIRSGSVFVWDEREAGMRRWTDGKSWSASRVSGSFLTYREMEGKRGSGFGGNRRGATKTPDSGRGSDEDQDNGEPEGYRYKADGLMKQSFSITTQAGQHLHLISYYSRPHPGAPEPQQPSTDPSLRHITPLKGMYPESSLHDSNPTPALTRAPMVQHSPYMAQQHAPASAPPPSYPPQYAQHPQSYQQWPPSPVATPPYNHHYTAAPYASHQQPSLPPLHAHNPAHHGLPMPQAPMQHHYAPPPPAAYERAALPPMTAQQKPSPIPSPYQVQQHSPRQTPVKHEGSPRIVHLQAQAAQAVLMDSAAGRSGQALPPISRDPSAMYTPPNRTSSLSPPRSSHAEPATVSSGNKTSISSLLQSTSSEPSHLGGSPRGGSPRTTSAMATGLPPLGDRPGGSSHDVRAIQMLDRKFCI
ncbi:camp-independent regulatory protein pac2 [Plectosphaerella plurivora]|uniref:Camp-independent regulatory protein pac2 n=1 Tax=Plectosphaerella plurivora TaxID=936078 RepID=A0A9P8V095_9PEZI|nr:camp-independent regulatory protein pac2 [Plectosphaerella plurivora]